MQAHILLNKSIILVLNGLILSLFLLFLYRLEGFAEIYEMMVVGITLVGFGLLVYIIPIYAFKLTLVEKDSKLYEIFADTCKLAPFRVSYPRFYIYDNKDINAAAWGLGMPFLHSLPFVGSCIMITTGAEKKLEPIEIQAIIAHEIGHIQSYDFAIGSVLRVFGLIKNKMPNFLNGATLSAVNMSYFLGFLSIQFALPILLRAYPQEMERSADLASVKILGSPDPAIRLFGKLISLENIPDKRDDVVSAFQATHPAVHTRLAYLLDLKI